MRHARIKNEPMEAGYYHAICRTVGQSFYFEDDAEKDRLLLWLEKAMDFCGVEVRAWCVMSNHVHLLVKVPPHADAAKISDEELERRMKCLYLPKRYAAILKDWEDWRRIDGNDHRVVAARNRLRVRMNDISWFMKTFKQAVAQDYNERHHHSGSIWGGARFKSVFLEGSLAVQLSVAAYIHLNPVRAGIVDAAEHYRWSSWGDACTRPASRSRRSLSLLYNELLSSSGRLNWEQAKAKLSAIHALARAQDGDLSEADVEALFAANGLIPNPKSERPAPPLPAVKVGKASAPPLATLLASKSSALTAAPIFGTPTFIQRFFETSSCRFAERRQRKMPAAVTALASTPLCILNDSRLGRNAKA